MAELLGGVAASSSSLGQRLGGVGAQRRQSPRPRGGTGPSSGRARRRSARRPTTAGRTGGAARPSARGSARFAPRRVSLTFPSSSGDGCRPQLTGGARCGSGRSGLRCAARCDRQRADIAAPPFPAGIRWLEFRARRRWPSSSPPGPLLVHFFDFAQLNSVRALPYLARGASATPSAGLSVLGVHSPRFPFTADRDGARAGARAPRDRLPGGARLRATRSGTTTAARAGRRSSSGAGRRAALVPLRRGRVRGDRGGDPGGAARGRRARRAPGAARAAAAHRRPGRHVAPPSEEVFPAGRRASRGRPRRRRLDRAHLRGRRRIRRDRRHRRAALGLDGAERSVAIAAPGLYELAEHPVHGSHLLELWPSPGLASTRSASPPGCRARTPRRSSARPATGSSPQPSRSSAPT